jgi:hypothetical protein
MLGQDKKRRNCLSKGHQKLGSGRKEPTLSGGLPMENGAMALLYGKSASVRLKAGESHPDYGRRKVWRSGLEVVMKIKSSQGHKRVEWVKVEHPFTASSPVCEVHANHNEAQNSALRRRASAYRRRQNLYAKRVEGLQRVLDVQRLIHNWVRPHWGLGKKTTPAMAMGYCNRPISTYEILTQRGFHCITC